jgi:hypothetical protein
VTGKPLAAATQRFALWSARNFFAWATAVGCAGSNPFLDLFEKTEHPLAIGALVALRMGLRTQEVLLREVRDLDDGGRFHWIDSGKTANAKRHLEVPELLRPYLLRLAAGQSTSAPFIWHREKWKAALKTHDVGDGTQAVRAGRSAAGLYALATRAVCHTRSAVWFCIACCGVQLGPRLL